MSIDLIYIEGSTLVIHKAAPATEKQGGACRCNDHAHVRDCNGFIDVAWGRVDGVM